MIYFLKLYVLSKCIWVQKWWNYIVAHIDSLHYTDEPRINLKFEQASFICKKFNWGENEDIKE